MGVSRRMRSVAAPAAKTVLLKSGFYSALRRVQPSRKLAILRYHAICGDEGHGYADASICVPPDQFARHVEYLARHYDVLRLSDAIEALRAGRSLPTNALAITFDDGYADNLEAARVLNLHGLSATFYITAGCLAGGEPFWPAEIRSLVGSMPSGRFTLTVDGRRLEVPCSSHVECQAAVKLLTRLVKRSTIPERERLRRELRTLANHPRMKNPMLSWNDLGDMQRWGMTIGAHTLTHPNLPSAGLLDARSEMVGCKQRLEAELGMPVTMFSYPNGGAERYFTPEIRQLAIEAGFEGATTSWNGFAGPDSDLFALERIQVSERLEDLVFALEVERFVFAPEN
jgi:peptidoglycan/xylan/chitin deacetylase (PgdA/CDA1 family)